MEPTDKIGVSFNYLKVHILLSNVQKVFGKGKSQNLYFFLLPFLCFFQLEAELALCEKEEAELQEYANQVLQQIADRCPDILEQVVNALEDSCWLTFSHAHTPTDWLEEKITLVCMQKSNIERERTGKKKD